MLQTWKTPAPPETDRERRFSDAALSILPAYSTYTTFLDSSKSVISQFRPRDNRSIVCKDTRSLPRKIFQRVTRLTPVIRSSSVCVRILRFAIIINRFMRRSLNVVKLLSDFAKMDLLPFQHFLHFCGVIMDFAMTEPADGREISRVMYRFKNVVSGVIGAPWG